MARRALAYGITFGRGGNPYDISNFDVFTVPESATGIR